MINSLRLVRWFTLVILAYGILTLSLTSGAMGAEPGKPRCAFIDIEKSPLGGLLEAELIVRDDTEWLERSEIDKILAEKKLQSLFAADAGEARMSLGQILKADILIILRSETKDGQSVSQLVVSETKRGLRIVSEEFQVSKDLEKDAATLVKLFDQGLEKSRQPINHIFAIPPFVSQNLTYEFDYLKSTYAQLIEQSLVSAPGVLVVEFEEARALANERRLVGDNEALKRNLPIYVLGEYRHELQGDSQQVKIQLKIMQGATELETLEETLTPETAASFLKRSAVKLAKSQGIAATIVSPEMEAEQLGKRAETFMSLANWKEALGLFEAGLLIQPERMEFHSRAIHAAQKRSGTYNSRKLDELEKTKELHRRVLEHLQILAAQESLAQVDPFIDLLVAPHFVYLRIHDASSSLSEKLATLEDKFQDERHQLALYLAHRYAEQQNWNTSGFLFNQAVKHLTPTKQYAQRIKMILKYQDHPATGTIIKSYAHGGYTVDNLRTVEGRRFLEGLRDHSQANSEVSRAADKLLGTISVEIKKDEARTQGDPENKTKLTFKPVDLAYQDLQGRPNRLTGFIGCLPVDNNMDVYYSNSAGVLLPTKTGFRQAWKPLNNTRIQSIAYDGRYVWLSASVHQQATEVWVCDTKTGESLQLTKDNDLPLLSPDEIPGNVFGAGSVSLAPVAIGHVIIAGYIGRTWVADVKINPQGKPKVNIFYEAKEVISNGDKNVDWANPKIAFIPTGMRTLSLPQQKGDTRQVVYIGRKTPIYEVSEHALLVDPIDLSVRIAQPRWYNRSSNIDPENVFEGSYYYAGQKDDLIGLIRIGLPGISPEVVIPDIKEGYVLFNKQDRMVNVVGMDWQRGSFSKKKLESFGPVPWLYSNSWGASERTKPIRVGRGSIQLNQLADSNQFGTIAYCSQDGGARGIVQVLFDGSGTTLEAALAGTQETSPSKKPKPAIASRPRLPQAMNLWRDRIRFSSMAFSPDGSYVITTSKSADQSVQSWNAQSGDLVANLLADPKGMTKVVFSPSGKYFATGGARGKVIVWDAVQQQPLVECDGQSEEIVDLAFSWNSDKLIAASSDRTSSVWTTPDGKHLFDIKDPRILIKWVGFSADDTMVMASTQSSPTGIWSASDGTYIGKIESMHCIAGFLADRSLIGLADDAENTLLKWDSSDGEFHELWPRLQGTPVAVSPDGKYLATFLRETFVENERKEVNRIEVWDLTSHKKIVSEDEMIFKDFHFNRELNTLDVLLYFGSVKRLSLEPKAPFPAIEPSKTDPLVLRTWTDRSGQHTFEAAMVAFNGKQVQLKSSQGKQVAVLLEQLSTIDQQFVRKHSASLKEEAKKK